ncbi:hypothetical protein [Bradyrhizobium sp. Gha]|uniref:hypothetical protein n=1 Tax=Bradyrhizobium sp. Gha TaxID=1855318 RepID=UPI0008EE2BBB|nr:hypothetical protein [Bradyrhizobium sp. Gha]SFJ68676.1 hypothetical protein SAMN05216525_1323 [Bradyrhizobium sp. Gha]
MSASNPAIAELRRRMPDNASPRIATAVASAIALNDRLATNSQAVDGNLDFSVDGKAKAKRTFAEGNRSVFKDLRRAVADTQAAQQTARDDPAYGRPPERGFCGPSFRLPR